MTKRPLAERLKVGMTAMLLCIAFYVFAPGFFDGIEKGLLRWKYAVRGEAGIDTSVVVVALTGEDIDALGGLPVKRSYYALAVSALSGLGVKTIGIDLGLADSGRSAPEYNDLLASEIASSGNVVLSGYFRSLASPGAPDTHSTAPVFPSKFACDIAGEAPWRSGFHFTLPYAPFLDGAAGLGHTNLNDDLTFPLCIGTRSGALPLFSLEVLLKGMPDGTQIVANDGVLSLRAPQAVCDIPYRGDGDASLNFTGGTGSLAMVSFLDFLRAYDEFQSGGEGTLALMGAGRSRPDAAPSARGGTLISVRDLRGKTVLLGVVAPGRSTFVDSPFGTQFPAIGLHALFIDNAVNGRFLRHVPPLVVVSLLLLIGVIGTLSMAHGSVIRGLLTILAMTGLHTIGSFILFSAAALLLPMFVAWFSGAVLIVVLLVHHQKVTGSSLAQVSGELERIALTVSERERKLAEARGDLDRLREKGNDARVRSLLDQIERYKAEIGTLQQAGEDLRPFHPAPAGAGTRSAGEGNFHGIVYDPAGGMAKVVDLVSKISASDATVLITGESGSGKEIVARAIHESSSRKGKSFIAVNCGALPETLLESELFGHEKGAFTGAVKEKPGRFEIAQGGTIFLDEIGETSESFQVKLLRVLQDGTYQRVGGTVTLKSDARVITATNRDLKAAVADNSFRADLFYRLNVLAVEIPPLRQRPGDIAVLARKFISEQEEGFAASESVMKALAANEWKGNIRELQSVITRGVLLAKADGRPMLRLRDLPDEIAETMQSAGDIEGLVIGSLREKGFSRSAISETADEIGGFNRGTVSEYFRGYCFDAYVAEGFDVGRTVARIAGSDDDGVHTKVSKKLTEYLDNALEFADRSLPAETVLERSKPKFKNLPRKYHASLEAVIRKGRQTNA